MLGMTFFFFLTEQQREDRGVQDEKQRVQPTHTAVPSRGTGAWREQREDRCKRLFFLPKRLQISPPVHLRLAWGVSGACCVP